MFKKLFLIIISFCTFFLSGCTNEKYTFIEAELANILNNPGIYRDDNLSGGYGVSWVEHVGDGVSFISNHSGKYISLRYASEVAGTLTIFINDKESAKLEALSTGSFDKKYSFTSARVDIPENSKIDVIRQAADLSINMDLFIVHNRELSTKLPVIPLLKDQETESKINTWRSFKIEHRMVSNSTSGIAVPLFVLYPEDITNQVPVVLLLHGITGRKEEWLAFNNFSSGGNLSKALLEKGYAVALMDIPMHGERKAHEFGDFLNNMKFIVGKWDYVYKTGMQDIQLVLENLKHDPMINPEQTAILGYSMGGVFVFATAAEFPACAKTLISCVPPVNGVRYRNKDPYSFAPEINSISILMIVGAKDPNSTLADSQETFDRIASPGKKLIVKDSEHSLSPYADDVLEWLEVRLK